MLEALFGSRDKENTLQYILARGQGYASEIADFYGTKSSQIIKQLEALEIAGILASFQIGRARVYKYNPRYYFLNELESLLLKARDTYKPDSTTLSDLKSGNITVYRTDPDNFNAENALLRNIVSDIKSGKTQQYPSNLETAGCFLNICSQSFYNSNTDADARLIKVGITPPNTKGSSVPGGLYDRQNILKQLLK